ncbi:MAG: MarR family transcriptional regulator [Clostridia bacterium]|nr:MarR family transcriptional regulator [Clostridia bacterium]
MPNNSTNTLINELINCSFPLTAIIFDAYCREYENINPLQVSVLNLIHDHKTLNMTSLARRLGYTNQRLTQPVDDLVRRGLLGRTIDDDNRRMVFVSLTEKGEDFLQASRIKARTTIATMLDKVMTEEEKNQLCDSIHTANLLLERLNQVK